MRSRGTQEYQKKIIVSFFSLENTYSNGIKAYFHLAGINVWNFGQHSVERALFLGLFRDRSLFIA